LVSLVEWVDVNIMYEIIDKFKTFVACLEMISEINTNFGECFENLKLIRK
jgi:hypothetical protein